MDYTIIEHDYQKNKSGLYFCTYCEKIQEPNRKWDGVTCHNKQRILEMRKKTDKVKLPRIQRAPPPQVVPNKAKQANKDKCRKEKEDA